MTVTDTRPHNSALGCPAEVEPRPVPAGTTVAVLQARIADLERAAVHDHATIRALTMVAGCREQLRSDHRDQVGDREDRIDQLRRTVADLLATFTDHDRPTCGGPRARSRWIEARQLAAWRNQIVEEG